MVLGWMVPNFRCADMRLVPDLSGGPDPAHRSPRRRRGTLPNADAPPARRPEGPAPGGDPALLCEAEVREPGQGPASECSAVRYARGRANQLLASAGRTG